MIKEYIDQHAKTIAPLHKDYSLKFWELSLKGDEEQEKALVAAKERYLKIYNNREEFQQIRQWISSNPRLDEIEARELKLDRKSTRLNSSHSQISYAVFCLK